jgi:hypothetical protein
LRAADHDLHPEAALAPAGILEVASGQLNVVFGTSRDTSDFVADGFATVVDQPRRRDPRNSPEFVVRLCRTTARKRPVRRRRTQ